MSLLLLVLLSGPVLYIYILGGDCVLLATALLWYVVVVEILRSGERARSRHVQPWRPAWWTSALDVAVYVAFRACEVPCSSRLHVGDSVPHDFEFFWCSAPVLVVLL